MSPNKRLFSPARLNIILRVFENSKIRERSEQIHELFVRVWEIFRKFASYLG